MNCQETEKKRIAKKEGNRKTIAEWMLREESIERRSRQLSNSAGGPVKCPLNVEAWSHSNSPMKTKWHVCLGQQGGIRARLEEAVL